MSQTYRVVKLLKNRLYPTYQLHAFMANKKTAPQDGLRLAGLITMDWLRKRLGNYVPDKLQQLPESSLYRELSDECLFSLHINLGFVVDIVSIPDKGIWTMQITEPDLGSDPGNPGQERQAVPGRVIETNVGFHITGQQLECGFQTIVSDPEGTVEDAEVYRLAVIRRLIDHPDFGLQQVTKIGYGVTPLLTAEEIKKLANLWKDDHNQLPCVIFTCPRMEKSAVELPKFHTFTSMGASFKTSALPLVMPEKKLVSTVSEPPYDTTHFARNGISFCRTYQLSDSQFERAMSVLKCKASPGDILILDPIVFGGTLRVLPYGPNPQRQAETMETLCTEMYAYPRRKEVQFGRIVFLSAAREGLLHSTEEALQQSDTLSQEWTQKISLLESQWKAELKRQDEVYSTLSDQLDRQKQYQKWLEQKNDQLVQDHQREVDKYHTLLAEKDEDIAYLKRKLSQPKEHEEIATWVVEQFSNHLILHPKALSLLENKSAKPISCSLICDAIDFLATDYWAHRYERISYYEMLKRCSAKYGRPFEVKPTGTSTIEYTPSQYKIKYYEDFRGKLLESPLDFHLRVGNDSESLLRIYFLHDDEKKLIVVGSLPRHLRTVTIQ